eukprot:TRINITY_DN2157_c0_g2_i1.p1 TRINITY_DN2157_c0_g2~~TRINITY_DN2157_c0_g2_i1.p1  ORF type:complete len:818 (+),score=291.57 TRINITY_DN2157_c0_g2_i1:78-2531(+)
MTSAPGSYKQNDSGAMKKMSFDAAHALCRLGYYESWRASLKKAEEARAGKSALFEGFEKAFDLNKKKAKEAREEWSLIGKKWASGPRGEKEGADLVKALQDLAKAAAEHCAAMRVQKCPKNKKEHEAQKAEPEEPWQRVEAAKAELKERESIMTESLREYAMDLLLATGWQAANTVGEQLEELEMAQEEEDEEEEFDDEEDEDDEEDFGDESDDEEKRFGEDYPGSSDDAIMDMSSVFQALSDCHWEEKQWKGVRLDVSALSAAEASAELQAIADVPGTFGGKALNAVRLVMKDLAGEKDALGEAVRACLVKAKSLELDVHLEIPAKPGKKHETWLKAVASAAAAEERVRGVALPKAGMDSQEVSALVSAVRSGGLHQKRCVVCVGIPGGIAMDGEQEWTTGFAALHKSDPSLGLPDILKDGNVLLEMPSAVFPPAEEGGPANSQDLLDFCGTQWLCPNFNQASIVSHLSLAVPPQALSAGGAKKSSSKAKAAAAENGAAARPKDAWYMEYGQRLIGAANEASHGFFFESWATPADDEFGERGLKESLEKGWINLAAEEQVMQPTGGKHTLTLVYLHGFTSNGYDYLIEPEYVYRPKSQKKSKKKDEKKKKKDDDDGEDDIEYEPIPGLKVVFPTAPVRKITAHDGEENTAWHDYITDFDGDMEDELSVEDLEEQTKRLHAILEREAAIVGGKNLLFGGASQGCGMALHAALTYSGELGAVVGTMGHLLTCTPIKDEWLAKKIPVYNYIGDADSTMPWEKWVKATWQRLEDAGAEVKTELTPGKDHGEHEDVWLRAFLKERTSPSSLKSVAKKTAKK